MRYSNEDIYDCSFSKDGIQIVYNITFTMRRSIAIEIKRDTRKITVRMPMGESADRAHRMIVQKFDWIVSALNKIEIRSKNLIKREYTTGSSHLYLGRRYIMEVVIDKKERVVLVDDRIVVYTKNKERVEAIMRKWYTSSAGRIFIEIAAPLINCFNDYTGLMPSRIENKYVKGYWGVCCSSGVIRLNIELMRAPIACIEYIIVHELCHLKHPNHSRQFYELVEHFLPDWKERKKLLEQTISCRD